MAMSAKEIMEYQRAKQRNQVRSYFVPTAKFEEFDAKLQEQGFAVVQVDEDSELKLYADGTTRCIWERTIIRNFQAVLQRIFLYSTGTASLSTGDFRELGFGK